MSICVIVYTIIGFFTHIAMQSEYSKDKTEDLDGFNPLFIKMSLVTVALCWPILIGIAVYQLISGSK